MLSTSISTAPLLAGLLITASTASALPQVLSPRGAAPSGPLNAVYWGQNGGQPVDYEQDDLTSYCADNSGMDIIILSFLYRYGNGDMIPSGSIGQACSIDSNGNGVGCDALASGIKVCQANNVKVLMSVGGAAGGNSKYELVSNDEATTIGHNLWEAYGPPDSSSQIPRPFGDVVVDGWDFNIESSGGSQYYPALINSLRSNFASESSKAFVISGAPMCQDPIMASIISNAQFDYLWVQFYNNNACLDAGVKGTYDTWKSTISPTPSKGAKIFLGLPASLTAASANGQQFYRDPAALTQLVGQLSGDAAFGGTMLWSAGFSDANKIQGCNYSQIVFHVLNPKNNACAVAGTAAPSAAPLQNPSAQAPLGTDMESK